MRREKGSGRKGEKIGERRREETGTREKGKKRRYRGSCWRCGKVGHKAKECVVKSVEVTDGEEYEDDGEEQVQIGTIWNVGAVMKEEGGNGAKDMDRIRRWATTKRWESGTTWRMGAVRRKIGEMKPRGTRAQAVAKAGVWVDEPDCREKGFRRECREGRQGDAEEGRQHARVRHGGRCGW